MIGREAELERLEELYKSDRFEFLVMYGRRRVGKTTILQEFAGIEFIHCPECGFHHTAGGAEYDTRSRGGSQRLVEIHVRKEGEADVGPLYQTRKLPRGNGIVHIRIAVCLEFLSVTFVFLCKAWHYGHNHKAFAWNAHLFSPPCLGYGAEHLLRGTRS